MLAGGTAGVAMWSVAIPPDVRLPFSLLRRVLEGLEFRAEHVCRRSNRAYSPLLRGHTLGSWTALGS